MYAFHISSNNIYLNEKLMKISRKCHEANKNKKQSAK